MIQICSAVNDINQMISNLAVVLIHQDDKRKNNNNINQYVGLDTSQVLFKCYFGSKSGNKLILGKYYFESKSSTNLRATILMIVENVRLPRSSPCFSHNQLCFCSQTWSCFPFWIPSCTQSSSFYLARTHASRCSSPPGFKKQLLLLP